MGNTLKYAKFWSYYVPIRAFLRAPGEDNTLRNQIFSLCKKCHKPKCSARSVVLKLPAYVGVIIGRLGRVEKRFSIQ